MEYVEDTQEEVKDIVSGLPKGAAAGRAPSAALGGGGVRLVDLFELILPALGVLVDGTKEY